MGRRIGPDFTGMRRSGLVMVPDHIDAGANVQLLAKRGGAVLQTHYPDWWWQIQADEENLMMIVASARLNIEYGYHLRILQIHNDPTDDWAKRAGANILERFGMKPGPFRPQKDAWKNLLRDAKGGCIPDMGDSDSAKIKSDLELSRRIATGDIKVIVGPDGKKYGVVAK